MTQELSLTDWQRKTLPFLKKCRIPPRSVANVTAVTHHIYRDPALFDARFDLVKSAFLMTRLTCGSIPCVLIVNRVTPDVESFCEEEGIRLDVDKSLPGGIRCLSLDCIQNMHRRVDSEYVLGIHGDGFPLRPGLECFVGSYDYIGAP